LTEAELTGAKLAGATALTGDAGGEEFTPGGVLALNRPALDKPALDKAATRETAALGCRATLKATVPPISSTVMSAAISEIVSRGPCAATWSHRPSIYSAHENTQTSTERRSSQHRVASGSRALADRYLISAR